MMYLLLPLFDAIFDAVEWFAHMFPDIPIVFELQAITHIYDLFYRSSFFIPYRTLFICLSIGFTFYSTKFVISFINWIIAKIPTIN